MQDPQMPRWSAVCFVAEKKIFGSWSSATSASSRRSTTPTSAIGLCYARPLLQATNHWRGLGRSTNADAWDERSSATAEVAP